MEYHTLILTPWMSPHRIVPWHKAVCDLTTTDKRGPKIRVIEEYDETICSPTLTMKVPSVTVLVRPVAAYKKGVKFSRINVMTRDRFQCQYCGKRLPMKKLNYDHVVPRIQGGPTVWTNIATSCYPCNDRKGSRTPQQAGMTLLRKPFRPDTLPMTTPAMPLDRVPDQWLPYLTGQGLEAAFG
jgi:5-methylcytosine-specific restriction endonuclease McrA